MKFNNTVKIISFIKDLGLIISLPIIAAIAIKFHDQKVSIMESENSILQKEISQLKSEIRFQQKISYSQALNELDSQKEIYTVKIKEYQKTSEELRDKLNGALKNNEINNGNFNISEKIYNDITFFIEEDGFWIPDVSNFDSFYELVQDLVYTNNDYKNKLEQLIKLQNNIREKSIKNCRLQSDLLLKIQERACSVNKAIKNSE
jgi:hypothetical protein